MNTEDFQTDVRQQRHDEQRAAQNRADAIGDAHSDLAAEALTLRRLELRGRQPLEAHDWWDSLYRLRDIADRVLDLEEAPQ